MKVKQKRDKNKVLTQEQIAKLLQNPYKKADALTAGDTSRKNMTFRAPEKNFDVLNVEETLREFNSFLRNVIVFYENNKKQREKAEAQELDLEHCIALSGTLSEKEKRMIFRRMTEALQTRRDCKDQNEILQPLYNYISDKTLMNKLAQVQGEIARAKETANNRIYGCRTAILDDFRTNDADGEGA